MLYCRWIIQMCFYNFIGIFMYTWLFLHSYKIELHINNGETPENNLFNQTAVTEGNNTLNTNDPLVPNVS